MRLTDINNITFTKFCQYLFTKKEPDKNARFFFCEVKLKLVVSVLIIAAIAVVIVSVLIVAVLIVAVLIFVLVVIVAVVVLVVVLIVVHFLPSSY